MIDAFDIINKARELREFKYWYGGKGQKATKKLADQFKKQYPNVWTNSYYNKALKDVNGKNRVGDCSYLVCYAYGFNQIGSYQIREKMKKYSGSPKDGMVLWKPGHVGIFFNGRVIELRGIDYDYTEERIYNKEDWSEVLFIEGIDYDPGENIDHKSEGFHRDEKGLWYRHTYGIGPETYYHDCLQVIDGKIYKFNKEGYTEDFIVTFCITKEGEVSEVSKL